MRFERFRDRLTWLLAEAQFLVLGVLFSVGVALVIFRPSMPGVPPVLVGVFAALLLFGPALFGFFVWLIKKLRERRMVEVHHVNAVADVLEKYYVEPEIWAEKAVSGANPYPVNGGSAWAVREFEFLEDVEELRVKGVWLEETSDTKLLTSKSHMEAIYGKLTESHIALNILRDSVSEFGADIQRRLVNSMAEARERGKLMDKSAVKAVFEDFEDDAAGTTDEDLPTLEPDDLPSDPLGELADEATPDGPADLTIGEIAEAGAEAATDGGTDE